MEIKIFFSGIKSKLESILKRYLKPIIIIVAAILLAILPESLNSPAPYAKGIHIFREILQHVFAEIAGFIALAYVFTYFFKQEIIDAIDNGLKTISNTLSESLDNAAESTGKEAKKLLEDKISPLIDDWRKAAEQANISYSTRMIHEHIEAPSDIEKIIEEARNDRENENYLAAENKLLKLKDQNRGTFKIISEIFSLYTDSAYKKVTRDATRKTLDLLVQEEKLFEDDPDFYRLLANAYLDIKPISVEIARKGAKQAIDKCIEIDPENPHWIIMLGYFHYLFDDISTAILVTKKALELAIEKTIENEIALAKNNLAYYFAEHKDNKKIAFEYTNHAMEYYQTQKDNDKAMSIDTKGFVTMKFAETIGDLDKAIELFLKAMNLDPRQDYVDHWRNALSLKHRMLKKSG